jgi:hypothetical protein
MPYRSGLVKRRFNITKVIQTINNIYFLIIKVFMSLNNTVESYSGARNTYSILCLLE